MAESYVVLGNWLPTQKLCPEKKRHYIFLPPRLHLMTHSLVQFKMVSTCSEKPICIWVPLPHSVSPMVPLNNQNSSHVYLIDDGLSSFQGRLLGTFSFHASLLQVIGGMMFLALCPQVVSQDPQHFRSSEMQATCDGCFACQSICSVVFLRSGMSRAVHTQEFSKVDVERCHASLGFPFHI